MGLHRDPEEYGIGPTETHVRRILWYQLCFLDIRTSESQGPRQAIRPGDFSTKLPLNIDDVQLSSASQLTDKHEWADMTFTRLRFEYNELLRLLYIDRVRLQKGSVSLTHVLAKIEAFRKSTQAFYGPMIYVSNPTPIQRAAQLLLSLSVCRGYINLLHPYLFSVEVRIPERLHQVTVSAGTQLLEDAIELETAPELQPWAWYASAYQQYHTAFLLLAEVFYYPKHNEGDALWACLDYVFETPPTPSTSAGACSSDFTREEILAHRANKSRHIIRQLYEKVSAFQEMRKPKVPVEMDRMQMLGKTDFPAELSKPAVPASRSPPESHPSTSSAPMVESIQQQQQQHPPAAPSLLQRPPSQQAPSAFIEYPPVPPRRRRTVAPPPESYEQTAQQNRQNMQVPQTYPGSQQSLPQNYQPYSHTLSSQNQ
jgi:hypothetical protein